jgi:hypothetical protein
VQLPDPAGGYFQGANDYNWSIKHCIGAPVSIGDYLPTETGVMQGPTKQGVDLDADSLIKQDQNAVWVSSPAPGHISGSCVPTCGSFRPADRSDLVVRRRRVPVEGDGQRLDA